MIELPVYAVYILLIGIIFVEGLVAREDMEQSTGDPDCFNAFMRGGAVDAAIYCLVLWVVSFWWNAYG